MTHQEFWNGEMNLPNLLNLVDKLELSILEYKQTRIIEEKLINEITSKTTFNLEYIKKIHALIFNNVYEHAGAFRTNQSKNRDTIHPAAYLVNDIMALYETIVLKKQKEHYSSIQELAEYIALVYSNLLFINPFLTGNTTIASVLANLILYKIHIKRIDFAKINQIPYCEYTSALFESINYNYTPITNIIKIMM